MLEDKIRQGGLDSCSLCFVLELVRHSDIVDTTIIHDGYAFAFEARTNDNASKLPIRSFVNVFAFARSKRFVLTDTIDYLLDKQVACFDDIVFKACVVKGTTACDTTVVLANYHSIHACVDIFSFGFVILVNSHDYFFRG